ncbi:MAG TPA: alpha/beta hydrolase [Polyangia bacterium]|jgi:acetyl esterase/lipase|nr:alpha/beta hydrolase [Polyangia bacterium]
MRTLLRLLGLLLAMGAAGAGALIVLPAPTRSLALAAIVASERSGFIVAAAVVALGIALVLRGVESPFVAYATGLLSVTAVAFGLLPLVQARQLAAARGVSLDLKRYLHAQVDSEGPGHPDRTVPYLTVDGRPLSLDVYLPLPRPATPSRALVVVHGGFWQAGQRGEASLQSRHWADLGYTVFDVEYRLAPQPNWQTAVGDVKCAVGWVRQHAASPDWNVDPAKLTLLGRSAGAHLALLAATTAGEADLPPSCAAPDAAADTSVESVVSLYGPTDLTWAYDHPANLHAADSPAMLRAFLGDAPAREPDRYRALSPTERATAKSPRTLLVQGGRDQFVAPDQMGRMAGALAAVGVAHETLFIPYAQHAFDFVPGSFSSQILEATLRRFLDRRSEP